MASVDVLKIENLRLTRGERQILRGVNLTARDGEIVALMGLSGGGKTTVLRCVAALEAYDGFISIDPEDVGMVFQYHFLFEHLTAMHNIMLAPMHVRRVAKKQAADRAIELLQLLGVDHRRNALPRELSGGEAQRVAIARAMAMDPPLLLMDEPTASLDPARRDELGETLRKLTTGGRTLLITTHDDDFARDFADRVVILAEGEVVEEGATAEVLSNPKHPATRALLMSSRA